MKPKLNSHRYSAATLALLITLQPAQALAGGSSSSGIGGGSSGGAPNMSETYNQAADQSDQGYNADVASAATWGAVAVTCGTACAMSYVSAKSMDGVCTGANLGGAAADTVMTGNLGGAFMAVMAGNMGKSLMGSSSAATGSAAQTATQTSTQATQQGAQQAAKKSHESCMTAAVAALQAATKAMAAANQKDAANQNAALGNALQDTQPTVEEPTMQKPETQNAAAAVGTQDIATVEMPLDTTKPPTQNGNSGTTPTFNSADPCRGNPKSSYGQMVACATKSDPNLPSFVKSPAFKDGFEKIAGKPANQFFGDSAASLTAGIGAGIAAGGGLNMESASALGKALAKATKDLDRNTGAYASSGGGRRGDSGGDSGTADMAALMQTMMGGMNPEGEKEQTPGVSAIEYANQNRSPASIAEDSTLSIFDRVTYRYAIVTRSWKFGSAPTPLPATMKP